MSAKAQTSTAALASVSAATMNEGAFIAAVHRVRPFELPADATARWLLLALYRQLERQAWAGQVVEQRLGGRLDAIGRFGALGHPDGTQTGRVPGLEAWTYGFHGVGCCFTHEDGTCIDVDFIDGGTQWIDPFFLGTFLDALPKPELVEARLIRPAPFAGHWEAELPTLRDAGLIELSHRLRLTPQGEQVARFMADAYEAIRQSKNAWSAAWVALHLGDALLAVELLADQSPASLLARADEERRDRVERLVAWLAVDEFTAPRLRALAELGREHAEGPALKQLERDPVDGSVSAALELVGHWADAGHVEAVLRVAQRVRGTVPPSPWVRTFAAELVLRLVRRDALSSTVRRQLLDALELPGSSGGHAGLLIAFLEVDRGLASLRRALNADTKVVRVEAAAALGVIGTKEALFELRTSESVEAQTVLSAMKSDEPADDSDSWAADAYKEFVHRFTGLRERWLAH